MINRVSILKYVIIILSLIFFTQVAQAIPNTTSTQGTFSQNANITVNGNGFGIKNPVAPLSWDDFESGVLNDKLGSAKIGTGWTHQATISGNNCCWGTICQPCTYYSNDISHAGTKSAKNIVDNYGYNFFGWTGQNLEEIYVYYWRYFDPYQSDVSNVCNHKQIYIYSNIPSQGSPQYLLGSTQRVDDVWPIAIQGDCSLTYTDYRGISRPTHVDYNDAVYNSGDTNSWKQWELFIKPDAPSSASNGAEYFWQNGKLLDGVIPYAGSSGQAIPVADRENINLVADSCSYSETLMRDFRIGALVHTKTSDGACSGGRAYNNQPDITYLDDLYVDNTRSRIMICNVATWSAKETNGAHCEIQIPHTTWNNTQIQFTANLGSFNGSEQLYLFVINEQGNVSQGYPINISVSNAPTINQVSNEGLLTNGKNFTISGSNFGVKSPVEPAGWDNFQNGNPGVSSPETRYPAVTSGGIFNTQLGTTDERRALHYSTGFQRFPNDITLLQDYGLYVLGIVDGPSNNKAIGLLTESYEWYASWWAYRDDYEGTAMRCTNAKIYGLFTGGSSGWNGLPESRWEQYFDGVPADQFPDGHMQMTDCNGVNQANYYNGPFPYLNQWIRVERYMNQSTEGYSYGKVNLDIKGEITGNFNGCGVPFTSFTVGNYFRTEDGTGATMNQYLSEMYIDLTQARLEVCDVSIYDTATHCEIQIPHTTWNDNAIQFTANLGSFNYSEQLYLFVVDANGNISEGYPIIFGDGETQSLCPSHDANTNNIIDASEITAALADWFFGNLSLNELIQLMGFFKEGTCL